MLGLVHVAAPHVHLQQVILAGARAHTLLAACQIGGHQREQVASASGCGSCQVAKWRPLSRCLRPPGCRWTAASGSAWRRRAASRCRPPSRRAGREVGDAPEALGLTCVKKPPFEVYRPDSSVLASGAQVLRISSAKRSRSVGSSTTELAVVVAERHLLAVGQHAQQVEAFAVQAQRLHSAARHCARSSSAADDGLGWSRSKVSSTCGSRPAACSPRGAPVGWGLRA